MASSPASLQGGAATFEMGDRMKKMLVLLAVAICFIDMVCAQVLITEVMYNPETSESDTEYVELYNQGDADVDISGWKLNTTSVQCTIPEGTSIKSNSSFLIADEDDSGVWPQSWPEPDFIDEITLGNTDSGVQLIDSKGYEVDTVGWGNPSDVLFEGSPHPGPHLSGHSQIPGPGKSCSTSG